MSEEQLRSLPPAMTSRALAGAAAPKKGAGTQAAFALPPVVAPTPAKPAPTAKQKMQALGRLPAGVMNKTEEAYAAHLEQLKRAGDVLWFKFEGIKLRLADKTFYTVDFFVMSASCELEAHEVKGRWEDDARVKIKVAAELYPIFKFIAVQKGPKAGDGYEWRREEF
jgi:hypothetical protein